MNWPSPLTIAAGAGVAGAGIGAHLSLQSRDDASFGDKLSRGALWGGAAGLAGYGAAVNSRSIAARLGSWTKQRPAVYAAAKAKLGAGFRPSMAAFSKAYLPVPLAAGAGSAIGAYMSPDHRTRGAMIGAGVGTAATLGLRVAGAYKPMSKFGKWGAIAGLAMAAGVAGNAMGSQGDESAGIINSEGETDYVSPQEAAHYNAGVKNRMRSMNAHGDIVLGSHNRRHG